MGNKENKNSEQISITLPDNLDVRMRQHAQKSGLTNTQVIEEALRAFLGIEEAVEQASKQNGEDFKASIVIEPVDANSKKKSKAAILMY